MLARGSGQAWTDWLIFLVALPTQSRRNTKRVSLGAVAIQNTKGGDVVHVKSWKQLARMEKFNAPPTSNTNLILRHFSKSLLAIPRQVTHLAPVWDTVADRGVSGPWGPQFCGALCKGVTQRFTAGAWGGVVSPTTVSGAEPLRQSILAAIIY